MNKIKLFLILLIPLLVISIALFSMAKGNIEDIIICSTNDESHYMPSDICEYYLLNYRFTQDDIDFLERRSGLAFFFDISNKAKRNQLLEYAVSKGVSINKPSEIDRYPPLHAALINNDPELVTFLLKNGANPNLKDKNHNLSAIEFLDFLNQTKPSTSRDKIKELLLNQEANE